MPYRSICLTISVNKIIRCFICEKKSSNHVSYFFCQIRYKTFSLINLKKNNNRNNNYKLSKTQRNVPVGVRMQNIFAVKPYVAQI